MTASSEHRKQNVDEPGYDRSEASAGKLLLFGGAIVVLIAIIVIVVSEVFVAEKDRMVHELSLAPESVELRELRARETKELNSYKVLDSTSGRYRIPIDRAMELIADEAYQDRR